MDWDKHKKQLLKDPAFRKALKETELEYQIARSVIAERIKRGLTQEQLAERIQTKQSVISRVENAKTVPSLSLLRRIAVALDTNLQVHFR
jgi:ribosome-binding protein aMBF1 (putative translation factor)